MSKKQLNHLLLILLLSAFLSVGCAHKPVPPSHAASSEPLLHQNRQIKTSTEEQIPSNNGLEDDFNDDFFEDEFEEGKVEVADPLSPWNRAMFHFNDKLYFWALKPLARGYKAITPDFIRTGVNNFFHNITTPIRLVNCILQGKGNAAVLEFSRFVVNTTIGVLGFGNPADRDPQLNPHDAEDLGQTLAKYGFGNGFYIVWPVLGPSTLRDSIGMVGDFFLDPVSYVEPAEAALGIRSFDLVNKTSFRIGDYESLKKAYIDPYVAVRNIYLQLREKKMKE